MTTLLAETLRLCLPTSIDACGSGPVFADPEDTGRFWTRTGYELLSYKSNYDKLQRVPASDPRPKALGGKSEAGYINGSQYHCHPVVVAWKQQPHLDILNPAFPQATVGYGSTKRGLTSRSSIEYLVKQFLASRPWPFEYDQKMLQRSIATFNRGAMNEQQLLYLRQVLLHRLHMNDCANQYVRALGLGLGMYNQAPGSLPPPLIEDWGPIAATSDEYRTISTWTRTVLQAGLFRPPRGPVYRKPALYLCWVVLASGGEQGVLVDAVERIRGMEREGRFRGSLAAAFSPQEYITEKLSTRGG